MNTVLLNRKIQEFSYFRVTKSFQQAIDFISEGKIYHSTDSYFDVTLDVLHEIFEEFKSENSDLTASELHQFYSYVLTEFTALKKIYIPLKPEENKEDSASLLKGILFDNRMELINDIISYLKEAIEALEQEIENTDSRNIPEKNLHSIIMDSVYSFKFDTIKETLNLNYNLKKINQKAYIHYLETAKLEFGFSTEERTKPFTGLFFRNSHLPADKNFINDCNQLIEYVQKLPVRNQASSNSNTDQVAISDNKAISESKNEEPIKWSGTGGQLLFVLEELRGLGFFALNTDLQAAIRKHFVDSEGKPFKHLKQVKQNYLNSKTQMPKKGSEIKAVLKNLNRG